MNLYIDKIRQEETEEYDDSNSESSVMAPCRSSSPFLHHEHETKQRARYQHFTTVYQPAHMKHPQGDSDVIGPGHSNSTSSKSKAGINCNKKDAPVIDDVHSDPIFSFLSPSSSTTMMYHRTDFSPPLSPSPSTTSFSSKMMLDNNRESILMNKALKKKRRESVCGDFNMTRKRPLTTTIEPRLTKSSVLLSQQHQESNHHHRRTHSSTRNRNRYYSLQQPISQFDKRNLAAIMNDDVDAEAGVNWDPHIDAFEILRAKITGITRSMQAFHVQELFQDDEKSKKKKLMSTTSSPLIATSSRNNYISNQKRRFSLANTHSVSQETNNGHRRIRSQSFLPPHDSSDEEEQDDITRVSMTSPNLTALFLTTNDLIHSRLDELSETASIKSFHNEEEVHSILEWQKEFLKLVTNCIHQSEELESLSTGVLHTEHRVRELMLVNDTINEQFTEREKQYEDRIRECQEVAQQQLMMIESLEELNADIDMKLESRRRELHRQEALLALDANYYNNQAMEQEEAQRWDFQKSVKDLLNMDDKHDIVQKMRWDIGMFVGGGVGTGHIIHSFENKLNGIDMMIAGTGTTMAPSFDDDDYVLEERHHRHSDGTITTESYSVSPLLRHIKLYQHHYILHLSNKDRKTRFALLPKYLWVPDHDTNQCQFSHCRARFTFFCRKHHCRRCGIVVCQRHSANRLPLFSKSMKEQWSRVCDDCFHQLIIQK